MRSVSDNYVDEINLVKSFFRYYYDKIHKQKLYFVVNDDNRGLLFSLREQDCGVEIHVLWES